MSLQPEKQLLFTSEVILTMLHFFQEICTSSWEAAVFSISILMTFLRAFRISELLCRSDWDTTDKSFLVSDVVLANDYVSLHVLSSKMDQKQVGKTIRLHRSLDTCICPVMVLTSCHGLLVVSCHWIFKYVYVLYGH